HRRAPRTNPRRPQSHNGGRTMSVSAMVKHHQAVTAIIAQAMSDYASSATGASWNNACFAFEADAIFSALSRAGYRITRPAGQTVTKEMVARALEEYICGDHHTPEQAMGAALKA